jgi:carbonyl reductase 1
MPQKVFVVTGANKGIGYAIVRGLASTQKDSVIYLTARNESLGNEALKKVTEELGDKKVADIRFHQLDITDRKSCETFADYLKKEHKNIDVLINNAGFAFPVDSTESAEVQAGKTIDIDYYGTKQLSDCLVPLIREGGRIVNVCSQAGIMTGKYSQERIEKFKDPQLKVEEIDQFVENYRRLAREDTRKEGGFPESAYMVSKAAEIAYTLIQARQLKSRNIKVNACCPGFVATDMSKHMVNNPAIIEKYGKPLDIAEGADTPIYLATDANAPDGQFLYQRKVKEWL